MEINQTALYSLNQSVSSSGTYISVKFYEKFYHTNN